MSLARNIRFYFSWITTELNSGDLAKDDFWSISGDFIHRHHVEPKVKLYVPTEESFPIPLEYIDVT